VPQSPLHALRRTAWPRGRSQKATIAVVAALVAGSAGGVMLASALSARAAPAPAGSGQTVADQATPAGGFPAHYAAPYLQIDGSDAGDIAADRAASGDKFYTLAFLIPKSGCTPQWEDGGDALGAFTSQVSALKFAGGSVIISAGGESGGELAQTCTSVSSLTAAYDNVVTTYGVSRLDFDIEGSTLSDTAANTRRNEALAALQAQDSSVQVDYTLAVAPDGLPSAELGVLQDAKSKGVKVSVVNIMTMDFGNGQNPLNDAISAAKATAGQLSGLYGISTAQAFGMMGLTPIAGQNDDNEVFSQSDASSLEGFAASNGVQELSFWEVDGFDKPAGFAYSKIFNAITGGGTSATPAPSAGGSTSAPAPAPAPSTSGGTSATPAPSAGGSTSPSPSHSPAPAPSTSSGSTSANTGPITGMDGLCVTVKGASTADFTPLQVLTCNGTSPQHWTVAGNGTLQALGKCMGVHHGATANGTTVDLYHCNNTGGQVWRPLSDGSLFNPQSGKCLDDTNWSTTPGTQLQIWSCTDAANQRWALPRG
jgi:chitinase